MTKPGGSKYKKSKSPIYDPSFIARFLTVWQASEHTYQVADALGLSFYSVTNYASKFRHVMGIELKAMSKKHTVPRNAPESV